MKTSACLAVLLLAAGAFAAAPPADPEFERLALLRQADELFRGLGAAGRQGGTARMVRDCERILALERRAAGPRHLRLVRTLRILAVLHRLRGDTDATRAALDEVVAIHARHFGPDAWQTTDAAIALADQDRLTALPPARRREADYGTLEDEAVQLFRKGKPADAVGVLLQARRVVLTFHGELHPANSSVCRFLAAAHRAAGNPARAERYLRHALWAGEQALGRRHPDRGRTRRALAGLHADAGRHERAVPLYRAALAVLGETLGKEHPEVAQLRQEMARALSAAADAAGARKDYRAEHRHRSELVELLGEKDGRVEAQRKLLAVVRLGVLMQTMKDEQAPEKERGQANIDFLDFLAGRYTEQGQHDAAVKVLGRVIELSEGLHGKEHWKTTDVRMRLEHARRWGRLTREQRDELAAADAQERRMAELHRQGRRAEAIRAAGAVVAVRARLLGDTHPSTVSSLTDLARLHLLARDHDRAAGVFTVILERKKATVGTSHPAYSWTLRDLGLLHEARGDHARARACYEQQLAVCRAAHGGDSAEAAAALENLGRVALTAGDVVRAAAHREQAFRARRAALGEGHPDTASARYDLAVARNQLNDPAAAVALLRPALAAARRHHGERSEVYATRLNELARTCQALDDLPRAEALFEQALDVYAALRGRGSPEYATCLSNLGLLLRNRGDLGRAEAMLRHALLLDDRNQSERRAATCSNLAGVLRARGDYAEAGRLYARALEQGRREHGEDHPSYAVLLDNAAGYHALMGDWARAAPMARQAADVFQRKLGETHPSHVQALTNLATIYEEMGDLDQALPVGRRAVDLARRAVGPRHQLYGTAVNNLAGILDRAGARSAAISLYRVSLEVYRPLAGGRHPRYAATLSNLGGMLHRAGELEAAEELLVRALAIRRATLPPDHADIALSLNGLAALHFTAGRFAEAERGFRAALAIRERAFGADHPAVAVARVNLATVYLQLGDRHRARELAAQALREAGQVLHVAAAGQSERQHLQALREWRWLLDIHLSVEPSAGRAYAALLAWKGAALARQRQVRLSRRHPELAGLFERLRDTSDRLTALALEAPPAEGRDAWRQAVERLSGEREAVAGELARRSAAFRREQAAPSPADLARALPTGAALVDLIEYTRWAPRAAGLTPAGTSPAARWQAERRLAAFVTRPGRGVVRVELGRADEVDAAVERWRRQASAGGAAAAEGAELRRRLWLPLLPHLGDAATVLLSPDGATARLPWAALPGKAKGTYLIEDVAIAVVPVPRLLGEPAAGGTAASLLVVGAVDHGQPRGVAATGAWTNLPATGPEVDAVRRSFRARFPGGATAELRGGAATAAALRREAPRHAYLHLATHGFFAPPRLRSVLAAAGRGDDLFALGGVERFHPGLLSGLALAGANRGPGGVLTALDVAELNLTGCELAVLSACETGLGETAGGEGLLGLQRAFQAAGARGVIASLWAVPDAATQALMARFYENLWVKKMTRLEALRQAQLWLLREGSRDAALLRGVTNPKTGVGRPVVRDGRLPPLFWGAFVLSSSTMNDER